MNPGLQGQLLASTETECTAFGEKSVMSSSHLYKTAISSHARPSVTLAAGIKKADGRRTKWVDSGGAKTCIASNKRGASKVVNKF
jgi:hypothetical protein